MKVDKYSIDGKVVGSVELSDSVFSSEVNDILIYELIKSANANLRQGTHKTKGRSEVSGGGVKPWRQKGTGRARAGSSRSPIWKGGGTVFGPVPRSYRIDLPRTLKRSAYRALFSLKARQGSIKVVEDFKVNGKTKEVAKIGKALAISKGTIIADSDDSMLKRSVKNIPWLTYNNVNRISSKDIFYSKELIITESAVLKLNERYAEGGK
ncbi:MAG TPA: 50S ribosomal protein L4 [Spirochaetota bacterium]|nr:50S ribosomal protein L4 [Spirochaetota bacterium]HPC41019.1 50S ribosomal protein L4 [Spirochaetota bacterium]HPL16905.1 50S ribosomal protein L4 [Spirochaetota bacterium]HQF08868.1 50S ribosomal protein L4 [Spirochaetota bacterium]HQH97487.1 50S ribosomal protein L4 [Spirochaetota bacterium]